MDLVVFGDDWNAHPSTTQHLIMNMDEEDRIVWVDSLGFRSPRLSITDGKRLLAKAGSMFSERVGSGSGNVPGDGGKQPRRFVRIAPVILPYHLNPLARALNVFSLRRAIGAAMERLEIQSPYWLSVTPVAVQYRAAVPHRRLAYLRLDDYADLPGVDAGLIQRTERRMMAASQIIFATAKKLLPPDFKEKSHYLPQGVDTAHFARTPLEPPKRRILGFFGLVAEWLDFDLIEAVARAAGDWTLEFIGPVRYRPAKLERIANISWKPAVSFEDLPRAIKGWTCAWIPFQVSSLTAAVNPLKVREYLAAGLATHCTPLPEVEALVSRTDILISRNAREIADWLERSHAADSAESRRKRRRSVADDSWEERARTLRDLFTGSGEKAA